MTYQGSQRRIPDALLERYLARDLTPDATARVEEALQNSPVDRERLQALDADTRAFLLLHPPAQLSRCATELRLVSATDISDGKRFSIERAWSFFGALVAIGAALLLFVQAPRASSTLGEGEDNFGFQTKGSLAFTIHRKIQKPSQAPSSERVTAQTVLHPGDVLQFEVHAPTDGFVAVLSKDASGQVAAYVPLAGTEAIVYRAAEPLLSQAVELDQTSGAETFYFVFAPKPFSLSPLMEALKTRNTVPTRVGDGQRMALVTLQKNQ